MESLIADEHPATCRSSSKVLAPAWSFTASTTRPRWKPGMTSIRSTWNPTGGQDWRITAPSEAADVTWMNNTLKSRAPSITVHDVAAPRPRRGKRDATATADQALKIDWGVLGRP